mgnify:CR=1 FL=1
MANKDKRKETKKTPKLTKAQKKKKKRRRSSEPAPVDELGVGALEAAQRVRESMISRSIARAVRSGRAPKAVRRLAFIPSSAAGMGRIVTSRPSSTP